MDKILWNKGLYSACEKGDIEIVKFIIETSTVELKKALEKAKKSIEKISKLEGLNKHMESIKVRF